MLLPDKLGLETIEKQGITVSDSKVISIGAGWKQFRDVNLECSAERQKTIPR